MFLLEKLETVWNQQQSTLMSCFLSKLFPPYLPPGFWHAWSFERLSVIVISFGSFHTIYPNGKTQEMRMLFKVLLEEAQWLTAKLCKHNRIGARINFSCGPE